VAAFFDEHRAGVGAIVVAGAALALGWLAWSRLGERVRGDSDLVLHPEAIRLEGAAPWIRADLKAEALRDASLDRGLPLDDPELVRRLARAFAMHPWVREVVAVRVFLIQGGIMGFGGAVLGSALGAGILLAWNRLARQPDGSEMFPFLLDPWLVVGTVAVATLVGVLAGMAPAMQAARLDPAVAIRG
jgi:hypothetical protein